jgi:predicted Ser/Thr protein kinase
MHTLEELNSGKLKGSKHIKISCGLTTFPEKLFELTETLEIMDLSNNKLSALPENFSDFKRLKIAFFSDNEFNHLPEVLGKCEHLEMIGFKSNKIKTISEESLPQNTRWLILTNNQIESIPASIGKCYRLQKLALAGNKLTKLPAEMANCKNLELIRISANLIVEIPTWLLTMPKLSWIAYAGNPFNENQQIENNLPIINWAEVKLEQELGQGASGVIYKAKLTTSNTDVAIKVFKGEVTSDGLPLNEMNACMAAGFHPNLIGVLGKIANHPLQKEALVLSLIPPSYKNLGNPPSFETCSRDVFDKNTSFSLVQIKKIIHGMASVCAHLHALGINHGDLYAHNILFETSGTCLLGDFGAATFYNKENTIEKIEIRAFGCLIDDLLTHLNPNELAEPAVKTYQLLRDNCMQMNVLNRPSFAEIVKLLDAN